MELAKGNYFTDASRASREKWLIERNALTITNILTGCSEKPSLHCSRTRHPLAAATSAVHLSCRRLRQLCRQSPLTLAFLIRCIGSPVCPTVSDAAVDTSSEITTKDLKEKKEVVEEAENGRDAPANGNANEENGEQEADNEVDEEEEEGGEEEEEEGDGEEEDGDEDEEAEAATGKRAAEDDEDDDVDTKKQKTDEDD
ncbi:prothymosin alpha [Equus caballus]|uniref:prothymosin alpha n=1 Tax=Equus caballus TaxID=9796 RepID=UPI000717D69E